MCSGAAEAIGVDPLVVRVATIAATMAGGVGLVLYGIAWALVPTVAGPPRTEKSDLRPPRGTGEVVAGMILLTLAALLLFRHVGLWFSDAVVWPTVLAAGGAAVIWRVTVGRPDEADELPAGDPQRVPLPGITPPATAVTTPPATTPPVPGSVASGQAVRAAAPAGPGPAGDVRDVTAITPEPGASARELSRTGVGIGLLLLAGFVFLQATGAISAARDAILALLTAVAIVGLIFAPWWLKLGRTLATERAERIRSQERAELAAHLHDSVLQTLALVQRRSEDPKAVAALARRQERELRSWLAGRDPTSGPTSLSQALERTAAEVEENLGATVEVVVVGDAPVDRDGEALVAAAREAIVNAAKFAGEAGPVAVYAELSDTKLEVFVRDRGAGFDPGDVPTERRGVRESIIGRMNRHGGTAVVHSSPGAGTEVELRLDRPA